MMSVVTAVSVWPTCAVPVMVGLPVAGVLVLGSTVVVSLTSMAVPMVRETPAESHCFMRALRAVASARTREVLPTTRVRALVSGV